jgi:hypothetical protein
MTGSLQSLANLPGFTTLDFDPPWRLRRRSEPTRDRLADPSFVSPRTEWPRRDRQSPRRNLVRNNDRTARSRPAAPPRHRPAGKAMPGSHPEARTMVLLQKIESTSGRRAAPHLGRTRSIHELRTSVHHGGCPGKKHLPGSPTSQVRQSWRSISRASPLSIKSRLSL